MSFEDGSTLVISPMSGLITVTAMPDKLRDVESFLNEFQASVLRQVMIEAKIVEVTLTKTFQFGIDWNVVNSAGTSGFTLRSDPNVQTTGNVGNVSFKLTGGSTQINAVLTALAEQGAVSVLVERENVGTQQPARDLQRDDRRSLLLITRTPLLRPDRRRHQHRESGHPATDFRRRRARRAAADLG